MNTPAQGGSRRTRLTARGESRATLAPSAPGFVHGSSDSLLRGHALRRRQQISAAEGQASSGALPAEVKVPEF